MTSVAPSIAARQDEYRSQAHFGSLDALRAVAVLCVVWHHTVNIVPWLALASRGFLGVDLFFVLSGFLITTRLLREEAATGSVSLPRFYLRWTLRIFPLYYAVVLSCVALGLVLPGTQWAQIAHSAPALLLYLTNWFPTFSLLAVSWSLATEEQFYLVWPPVQQLLGRAALPVLGVFLVANQLVNFGLLFTGIREGHEILQVTFTPLCLGVFLAHLLHHRFGWAWAVLGHRRTLLLILAGLAVAVAWPSAITASLVGLHRLVIHLLLAGLVGALVVREDHVLQRFVRRPRLVRLGVVSYGVYLLHMFVRHAVIESSARVGIGLPRVLLFAVVAVATYLAAEVSFRYFESPIRAMKAPDLAWLRGTVVKANR